MFLAFATAAAAAAATDNDPTVAIIAAIGTLIVAVLGALGIYVKNADARADRLNDARVDDAVAGEEQLRKERDEARSHTARAYKECDQRVEQIGQERDKWMKMWAEENARANRLEVENAVLRRTAGTTGAGQ